MNYVALFRGLNVGGRHKVKMADLRALLESAGFSDVKTYIQSGNVIFTSTHASKDVKHMIETAFSERFGFQSPVQVRTSDEWRALLDGFPFDQRMVEEAVARDPSVEHVYVFFAEREEDFDGVGEAASLVRRGRNLYLLTEESILKSTPAATLLKREGLTSRNWKTIVKIAEMLGIAF